MQIDLDDKEVEFILRCLMLQYAEDHDDFSGDISSNGLSYKLFGKIIRQSKMDFDDAYKMIRNLRVLKTSIGEYLFMGAGYHSTILLNKLHKRLSYAGYVLGGMQQNGGQGSEFDEASDKEDKQSLIDIVKDMLVAFGLTVEDLK